MWRLEKPWLENAAKTAMSLTCWGRGKYAVVKLRKFVENKKEGVKPIN